MRGKFKNFKVLPETNEEKGLVGRSGGVSVTLWGGVYPEGWVEPLNVPPREF
jgi:hypothetical protein